MNRHVNPDQGIRQIAPGVACHEVSVGANVTSLAYADAHVIAGLGDGRVVAVREGQVKTIAEHKGAVTGLIVTDREGIIEYFHADNMPEMDTISNNADSDGTEEEDPYEYF